MIICSLAALMASRKLNISDVSRDTGISRTTLTALYYNDFKGIQCATLNSLCRYFNVTADKLLLFSRYDIETRLLSHEISADGRTVLFTAELTAADGRTKRSVDIRGSAYIYNGGKEAEIYADEYAESSEHENVIFVKKAITSLNDEFKGYINETLIKLITESIGKEKIRVTAFKGI